MEFEFDKEIDSLLRQAAREGELAFNNSQSQIPNSQFHLDADEISAFAENALPKKARLNAVNHLADCTRCRKILADVIAFNAEEASEIIHAQKEPKTIIAAPKIPWYRQLFAFSNLTYTMGALVLLFGGLMTYVVYQSAKQDQNSSVAQVEKFNERPQNAKGASSDGETTPSVTYSNANSSSNSTVNSNSRMANALNTVPSKEPVTASPTVSNSAVSAPPPILDRGKGEAGKDAPNDSVTTDNKAKSADSEATKTEDKTENKRPIRTRRPRRKRHRKKSELQSKYRIYP